MTAVCSGFPEALNPSYLQLVSESPCCCTGVIQKVMCLKKTNKTKPHKHLKMEPLFPIHYVVARSIAVCTCFPKSVHRARPGRRDTHLFATPSFSDQLPRSTCHRIFALQHSSLFSQGPVMLESGDTLNRKSSQP